jgi:NAD(P)-dependent dehydrogenase (short-subunit alcohol dehydrogenase family)
VRRPVNAVAPGPVETGILNRFTGSDDRKTGLIAGVPLKRVGEPDEIAQAIVFLASEQASFLRHAHLLPAKTRVFVDFVVEAFRKQRLAERLD